MGKGGSFDFKEIEKLQKQIEQMERDRDRFCEACAKELAARLLAKVIKRTPVGKAPKPGQGWLKLSGWMAREEHSYPSPAQFSKNTGQDTREVHSAGTGQWRKSKKLEILTRLK